MTAQCSACGTPAPEGASWCEACGGDLDTIPVVPCVTCGGLDISADGYCNSCGHKQPAERDHIEEGVGGIYAVTDRGRRHHHNEDAYAFRALPDGRVILVVCDGVSSTPGSVEVSVGSSVAAADALAAGLGPIGSGQAAVDAALITATAAAQAHAMTVGQSVNTVDSAAFSPSSTFVMVLATPRPDGVDLDVAWLGDSRAYWLGAEPVLLTTDHEIGGSLSRWLGSDAVETEPDVAHFSMSGLGRLIVCSDGLWRYANSAEEMASLIVESLTTPTDPGEPVDQYLARNLIDFANQGGGHDNITAVVWSTPPPPM